MQPSRREVLVGTTLLAGTVLARPTLAQPGGQEKARPAVIDARDSLAIALTAVAGSHEFRSGAATPSLGFNQAYLGPTIRVKAGTTVQVDVNNQTDRTISVHWHGLLVPGEVDGGPHQPIPPGASWRPSLTIDQPAATLIYHTHIHGETADGVYRGLGGVLIIDDGRDAERGLPNELGVDDLVLVIQDKRLSADGTAVYDPTLADSLHGFLGDTIAVNGVVDQRMPVPVGIARLRLVNLSNARNYDLVFADGRPLHLIATDQGLLPNPIEVQHLRLAPAERAEVLVDFGDGGRAVVMSFPHEEGVGAMGMTHDMGGMPMQEDPFDGPYRVVTFTPDPGVPARVGIVPARITSDDEQPHLDDPSLTRDFILNDMGNLVAPEDRNVGAMPGMDMGGMPGMNMAPAPVTFGINAQPFDMDRIDHTASAGTTERWIVGGQMMGHPFHIHGARFRVVSESGAPPRAENSGWKDTVFVTGEIELLAYFPHPAPPEAPFMFHCHVLEHEDRGMMGQFTVSERVARDRWR